MEVFSDYAYYYNAFYGDKDYVGESAIINKLINSYSKQKVFSMLNMGCGTGRHDFELSKLGYQMQGIDMSETMIKEAKADIVNENVSFAVADIRKYEVARQYDAVISLFHVMSYQNTNVDVLAAFKTANRALQKGGIFLFDTWYGPGVLTDRPAVRIKRVEDAQNILIRHAQPVMHAEKNVVDVCYNVLVINKETSTVKEINEIHNMRYFFKPEIENMLMQTGFRLVECLDCDTMQATDYNSWTAYFIAEKEKEY